MCGHVQANCNLPASQKDKNKKTQSSKSNKDKRKSANTKPSSSKKKKFQPPKKTIKDEDNVSFSGSDLSEGADE
jgi:hypothetical protein